MLGAIRKRGRFSFPSFLVGSIMSSLFFCLLFFGPKGTQPRHAPDGRQEEKKRYGKPARFASQTMLSSIGRLRQAGWFTFSTCHWSQIIVTPFGVQSLGSQNGLPHQPTAILFRAASVCSAEVCSARGCRHKIGRLKKSKKKRNGRKRRVQSAGAVVRTAARGPFFWSFLFQSGGNADENWPGALKPRHATAPRVYEILRRPAKPDCCECECRFPAFVAKFASAATSRTARAGSDRCRCVAYKSIFSFLFFFCDACRRVAGASAAHCRWTAVDRPITTNKSRTSAVPRGN